MKVLLVASLYHPHIGGIETIITELSYYYKRADINVVVLTKKWPTNLNSISNHLGTPIYRVASPKKPNDYYETLKQIKQIQHLLKADIIHVIGARKPLPLFALLLAKMWDVPIIISIAGSEVPHPCDIATQRIWQSGIDIIPDTIRQSDKITVFSKDLGQVLNSVMPDQKYEVLYAGIDLSIFTKPKIKKNIKPYILSLRRLIRSKGIDILIKAFSLIENKFPGLELYIAGDGEERNNLENQVKLLKLEKKIKFLGSVSLKDSAKLLKNARLTVVPSRSEGGGLVNIEAQSCGCPVIASRIGGIPEYIDENKTGLLFKPEDHKDLAFVIEKILSDNKLKKKLVTNGKKFAKTFSWDLLIPQYISLYNNAIHGKRKSFTPWSILTQQLWEEVKMETIAYKIIKQYDIPRDVSIELLRDTDYNTVFLIHDKIKKILRISKKNAPSDLIFELDAIEFLIQNNIPTAKWIKNKKNQSFSRIGDFFGVVFEFINGKHVLVDKNNYPTKTQAFQAGALLGKFHNKSKNFNTKSAKGRTIYTELVKILDDKENFKQKYSDGQSFIQEVKKMIDFARSSTDQIGLIHNDYRPHNVFFGKTNIKALIDLDWSCTGPLIKDLALGLVEWSFPDGAKKTRQYIFDNFLRGYNSTQKTKIKKNKNLYYWIMFSCLSDAATYLNNKISTTKGEQIRSFMYLKYIYYKKFTEK